MKQLFLLVKTGFWNQWRIHELKYNKDKKKRNNMILLFITFLFIGFILVTYAAGGAFAVIYMGMEDLVPLIAVCAVSFITLFFTVLKTNGILFGYKDYEMLVSLPVRISTLVAARFMQLYLSNLIISVLIMAPMGLVMGIVLHKGIIFYLMWLIAIPVTPLVPTTIATIIGTVIMAASSRMKHANAVSAVLSLLLIIAILVIPMRMTGMEENFRNIEISRIHEVASQSFTRIYPVGKLFQNAVIDENWLSIGFFAVGSYVWYRLFTLLTAIKYRSIQSRLTAHRVSVKKTGRLSMKQKTAFEALLNKEWKRFFNSNIYLLNMGMGAIMVMIVSIALFFTNIESLQTFMSKEGINLDMQRLGAYILPFMIAGISGMSCLTSCALSLEGSNIYMLKALPLEPIAIYKSKIAMNLILILPASVIASLLMAIRFSQNAAQAVLMVLVPLAFNILTAFWGMYINIKLPNYSWENEAVVIKQNIPSLIGMFSGLLIAIAGGGIVIMLPEVSRLFAMAAVIIIALLAAGILYSKIKCFSLPVGE